MAQPDDKAHIKASIIEPLTRHEQLGVTLSPDVLQFYKEINESLPVLIVQGIDAQLNREYRYALGGQIVAALALILMAGGFVFLVMNGHEKPAYALLGAGVLNVIGGFVRARLTDGAAKHNGMKSRSDESE
jgi:hypothetical protein